MRQSLSNLQPFQYPARASRANQNAYDRFYMPLRFEITYRKRENRAKRLQNSQNLILCFKSCFAILHHYIRAYKGGIYGRRIWYILMSDLASLKTNSIPLYLEIYTYIFLQRIKISFTQHHMHLDFVSWQIRFTLCPPFFPHCCIICAKA